MNANQQPKEDLGKLGSEKQPWTEAWELAWEGYQAQEKLGGDEKLASLRNRAKQENDARYLGPIYLEVFEFLPKADHPKAPQIESPSNLRFSLLEIKRTNQVDVLAGIAGQTTKIHTLERILVRLVDPFDGVWMAGTWSVQRGESVRMRFAGRADSIGRIYQNDSERSSRRKANEAETGSQPAHKPQREPPGKGPRYANFYDGQVPLPQSKDRAPKVLPGTAPEGPAGGLAPLGNSTMIEFLPSPFDPDLLKP